MKLDLHLHTTASDGAMSPTQLVELLRRMAFELFAITDHDTLRALPEASEAAARYGMSMIPGVELSTGGALEIHILGYGMNRPPAIEDELSRLREARRRRLGKMIAALDAHGVHVEPEQVPVGATDAPGRVHLARALVNLGRASGVQQAFQRYLNPGRPGYVEREKLTPQRAIELIHAAGGVAVLAHPGILHMDFTLVPELIAELKQSGLDGVEAHHPCHTAAQIQRLDALARAEDLLVTGGSDHHGLPGKLVPGDGLTHWSQKDDDCSRILYRISMHNSHPM